MNQCLHGIRGVLVLWVISFYLTRNGFLDVPVLNHLFLLGWLGIHLLFMLVAYAMTAAWMNNEAKDNAFGPYIIRRLACLYPSYFVSFLLLWLLFAFFELETFSGFGDIFGHFLLLFHLPPLYASPMNAVWSILSVLMLIYLIFPTLMYMMKFLGVLRFLFACFAVMLVYRWMVVYQWQPASLHIDNVNHLPGILGYVAVGMALAYVQGGNKQLHLGWLSLCGLLSAVSFLMINMGMISWYGLGALFFDPLIAITVGLLVHAIGQWSLLSKALMHWFSGMWCQRLGNLSYGLLLWHLTVFKLLSVFLSGWLFYAVATAAVMLLAWLNYEFIERRFMVDQSV